MNEHLLTSDTRKATSCCLLVWWWMLLVLTRWCTIVYHTTQAGNVLMFVLIYRALFAWTCLNIRRNTRYLSCCHATCIVTECSFRLMFF